MSCIHNIITYEDRQGNLNPTMRNVQAKMESVIGREEKHYSDISVVHSTTLPHRNPSSTSRRVTRHMSMVYLCAPICVIVLLLLIGLGGELLCGSGISSKDQSFALLLVGILLVGCGALYRKLLHPLKGKTP
jgi:hypothetical protein